MEGTPGPVLDHKDHLRGMKNAIPVAVGYIPVAIAYGLLAKNAGIPFAVALGFSLLVYAGASQFAAISMIASGQGVISIVLLTLALNFRHFLMNTAIAARYGEKRMIMRALAAFGITDETFAVVSFDGNKLTTNYLLALNTTAYVAWVGASALGYAAGEILPRSLQASMGIALYAMFVGLLIPNVLGSRVGWMIVLVSMALNAVVQRFLQPGIAIVVVALIVAAAATLVLPLDQSEGQPPAEGRSQ